MHTFRVGRIRLIPTHLALLSGSEVPEKDAPRTGCLKNAVVPSLRDEPRLLEMHLESYWDTGRTGRCSCNQLVHLIHSHNHAAA